MDDEDKVGIKTPKDINLGVAQALFPKRYHLQKKKRNIKLVASKSL